MKLKVKSDGTWYGTEIRAEGEGSEKVQGVQVLDIHIAANEPTTFKLIVEDGALLEFEGDLRLVAGPGLR